MNGSARVTMIAGWAQTAAALAPLAAQLFPGRFVVTSETREAEGPGPGAGCVATLTSVAALLAASGGEGDFHDGSTPSAYAAGLALQLVRRDQPSTLIGWSMGGMVALETAIHFPDLVRRLVLISSCATFDPPGADSREARSLPVRALIVGLHRDRVQTLRTFFSLVHSENGCASQPARDLERALQIKPDHLVHGLRYIQTIDVCTRLAAIRVPAWIVHGRKDRVISWKASQLLHAGIGGSELLLVDDGDHGLAATSPAVLAPAISRFFHADPLLV